MSTVKRFEDLEIWQQAREISKDVYEITKKETIKYDFSLIDQLRRSSGSIMDNIAEGFERDGNKEFIQFLSIAKGSSGETRSQLYRAIDQHYIDDSEFQTLYNKLINVSIKIKNMMSYLKKSGLSGDKFKK
jgi:four helix bundle protein